MPKKPKKRSFKPRKRRPISMYLKGWETRRRNQERKQGVPAQNVSNNAPGNPNLTTGLATPFPSDRKVEQVSAGEAIIRMSRIHRDEQLCCFLGDMQTMRRHSPPNHAPVMLTRSQAEAIEVFLTEQGFSMFGPRTNASGGIVATKA